MGQDMMPQKSSLHEMVKSGHHELLTRTAGSPQVDIIQAYRNQWGWEVMDIYNFTFYWAQHRYENKLEEFLAPLPVSSVSATATYTQYGCYQNSDTVYSPSYDAYLISKNAFSSFYTHATTYWIGETSRITEYRRNSDDVLLKRETHSRSDLITAAEYATAMGALVNWNDWVTPNREYRFNCDLTFTLGSHPVNNDGPGSSIYQWWVNPTIDAWPMLVIQKNRYNPQGLESCVAYRNYDGTVSRCVYHDPAYDWIEVGIPWDRISQLPTTGIIPNPIIYTPRIVGSLRNEIYINTPGWFYPWESRPPPT